MSTKDKDIGALKQIISYCGYIDDMLKEEKVSSKNRTLIFAISFCLIQIGEYSKQLSDNTRNSNPKIPWSLIIGFRNVITHNYRVISDADILSTAETDIPELMVRCKSMIKKLETDVIQ